jgi:hypothetical protein
LPVFLFFKVEGIATP